MGLKNKEYINYIESLINIFTVEQGQIKILLFRKKVDPYKGYWELPSDIVRNDVTIEDTGYGFRVVVENMPENTGGGCGGGCSGCGH